MQVVSVLEGTEIIITYDRPATGIESQSVQNGLRRPPVWIASRLDTRLLAHPLATPPHTRLASIHSGACAAASEAGGEAPAPPPAGDLGKWVPPASLPFDELPNVLMSPNTAEKSYEYWRGAAAKAAQRLDALAQTGAKVQC